MVALKVVSADHIDETAKRRFERECRAMGSLSWHPNVVAVHDSGVDGRGRPWFAMEYLEAGSLGDRLDRSGTLPWDEAVVVGIKVAGALAAAHANGVLHRDLKPENLLVAPFGEVKLSDFGIAVVEGATRTTAGNASFTVAHVPPEVLDNRRPDERSDVYGLGSTLHTLISGTPPFVGSSPGSLAAVISAVLNAPAPRLDDVPDGLADLLLRTLAKDPGGRPSSAEAFGRELQQVQADAGLPVTELRVARSGADSTGGAGDVTAAGDVRTAGDVRASGDGTAGGGGVSGGSRGSGGSGGAVASGGVGPAGDPEVTVVGRGPRPGGAAAGAPPALVGDPTETIHGGAPGEEAPAPPAPVERSEVDPRGGGSGPAGSGTEPGRRRRMLAVALGVLALVVVGVVVAVARSGDGGDGEAATTVARRPPEVADTLTVAGVGEVGDLVVLDGSLFVSSQVAGSLSEVDPDSGEVLAAADLPAAPTDLTVSDGALLAVLGATNEIARVDPATLEVGSTFPVGPVSGTGVVTVGRIASDDSAVWVTLSREGTGGEADLLSADIAGALESVVLGPTVLVAEVAVGEGSAWVAGDDRIVRRIDGFTNTVTALIPVSQGGAGEVVVSDGVVWVAGRDVAEGDAAVSHVDPATNTVTETIDVPGGSAGFIAAGLGAIWVSTEDGSVARIDPETLEVTDTIEIPGGAGALTVGAGSVWVAGPGADTITRIDPGTS